ncbi:hypothetical protein IWQ61_010269 [Dispira simplex]|nr:hypothetical protein IWQ61_010269 [Dispira simplex]
MKTKTLVLKPKAAKSAPTTPVVIVALEQTQTNLSALAKQLQVKEMRLANEDLLKEFFGVTKDEVTPFVLSNATPEQLSRLILVVDAALVQVGDAELVFRAPAIASPIQNTATGLLEFFRNLPLEPKTVDFQILATNAPVSGEAKGKSKPKSKPQAVTPAPKTETEVTGTAKIGVEASKDADFSKWYQQVLLRAEMIDYYDVSGCYIIRPWAFHVWKSIQKFFGEAIERMGVEDAYFPMFVSHRMLEQEKDHIEGFAPEVAWVTKAGSSDLNEPIAVRPTSETVIYPYFAKWIRSHRDLPMRINQWSNVVRWEFKHPQPFLRTREFLWQEGHTAHLTREAAGTEVKEILDLYRRVYEELLAVPVIPGIKSEREKFAGSLYTTTVEGYIPATGRGIQGGTSHCLGQNFSKMFNVVVEDPSARPEECGSEEEARKLYVWQNSWGLSTRTIGVMVMVHGDDKGLVMPPRVSSIQVVVMPCGLSAKNTPEVRRAVIDGVQSVVNKLQAVGVRAHADLRDNYNAGYKFNHWELRGVPLRLEIGPKDLRSQTTMAVRRDTGSKQPVALAHLTTLVPALLEAIQGDMFRRAREDRDRNLKVVTLWEDFVPTLNRKAIILMPWCHEIACEESIKERSARGNESDEPEDEKAPSMGAKSLCIPFEQPTEPPIVFGETLCVGCGIPAKSYGLFGRSY